MARYLTQKELEEEMEEGLDDFDGASVDMSDEDLDDSDNDPNYNAEWSDMDSESDEDAPGPSKRQKKGTFPRLVPDSSRSSTPDRPPTPTLGADLSRSPSPQIARPPNPTLATGLDFSKLQWTDPVGLQNQFPFTGSKGMDANISALLAMAEPIEYFALFLSDDVINLMVDETNLYATQQLLNADAAPQSRLHKWYPTCAGEMKRFIGLIGWMGLVKLPRLCDYWSTNELFSIPLPKKVMSRNRFELLLRFWHFANNEEAAADNRLCKIENVINKFIHSFQSYYTPAEKICIDESVVPWRGRLVFRQYLPKKRHRYGIKLYKLCAEKGYTWNMSVYIGKDSDGETSATEQVVMKLAQSLLNEGRTLYVDNFYTGIPLAFKLLDKKTHLVGTLRSNRKYIPQAVKLSKLKKGQLIAKETSEGVTVLKWRDQRDVFMLTTRHVGDVTVPVKVKQKEIQKPVCILDYDQGKFSVDVSDQLASYNTALRRCTKWYRKLMIEIIWGMSFVNAYYLYQENSVNQGRLTTTDFKFSIIKSLIASPVENSPAGSATPRTGTSRTGSTTIIHHLIQHPEKKRARCTECYKRYGKKGVVINGKKKWASLVWYICDTCEGNPHYCKTCFNEKH